MRIWSWQHVSVIFWAIYLQSEFRHSLLLSICRTSQSFVILVSLLQWRWQWASIGHFVFLFCFIALVCIFASLPLYIFYYYYLLYSSSLNIWQNKYSSHNLFGLLDCYQSKLPQFILGLNWSLLLFHMLFHHDWPCTVLWRKKLRWSILNQAFSYQSKPPWCILNEAFGIGSCIESYIVSSWPTMYCPIKANLHSPYSMKHLVLGLVLSRILFHHDPPCTVL